MMADMIDRTLSVERLLNETVFPHEVASLDVLETHISWVILTGTYAYKIKKPVTFDFVDYSSLAFRKTFCEKEIELNRRFAPDLYLGMVPIFEVNGELQFGDELPDSKKTPDAVDCQPIEYAVKMQQFPQAAIVAARLNDSSLTYTAVEQLGRDLAVFHDSIECAQPTLASVNVDRILANANDNFELLLGAFTDDLRQHQVKQIKLWTIQQFRNLPFVFQQRLKEGKVRRCHGDLHLKNIIQLEHRLIPFDGIEFNEDFQWIDVINEIAFPVMDFAARNRSDLGWRLLNAYLETTGDYAGSSVLRFYLVYRAMVRAKVTWLNPKNKTAEVRNKYSADPSTIDPFSGPWDKYLAAAESFAFGSSKSLSITHGFSGSGKSTIAMQMIDQQGGIRIRSDAERNRLAKRFETSDKYSNAMNDRVYAHVLELARTGIESGLPVIVDATFLRQSRRSEFETLAKELAVPFGIIDCNAAFDELCSRIQNRGNDPSEATIEVLRKQMDSHDPLTIDELQCVILKR